MTTVNRTERGKGNKLKQTRRVLALLLTCALLLPVGALAAEPQRRQNSFSVSEYDMLVSRKSASMTALMREGCTKEEIALYRSDYVERELLARAALPDETLARYGYTPAQIEILRAYDGRDIRRAPALRGVMATLSGSFSDVLAHSTSRMGIKFTWNWSSSPINRCTDNVAVAWEGTGTSGGGLNVRLNTSLSSCDVTYVSTQTGVPNRTIAQSFQNTSPTAHTEIRFAMLAAPTNPELGDTALWAKSGIAEIYVDKPTGATENILEASFCVGYGHTYFPLGYSIGFGAGPLSISFSPSAIIERAWYGAVTVDLSGNTTQYN